MILELYAGIVIFSLILLWYGWHTHTDLYRIIALLILFYCGTALSPAFPDNIGKVEIQTGLIETVAGATTTTTYTYENFESHTLSFWLVITSILGMVMVWVSRRPDGDEI